MPSLIIFRTSQTKLTKTLFSLAHFMSNLRSHQSVLLLDYLQWLCQSLEQPIGWYSSTDLTWFMTKVKMLLLLYVSFLFGKEKEIASRVKRKKKKIENWCFQCAKNQENQPNKDAGHLFLYNIFRGVRGRAKDMHTIWDPYFPTQFSPNFKFPALSALGVCW